MLWSLVIFCSASFKTLPKSKVKLGQLRNQLQRPEVVHGLLFRSMTDAEIVGRGWSGLGTKRPVGCKTEPIVESSEAEYFYLTDRKFRLKLRTLTFWIWNKSVGLLYLEMPRRSMHPHSVDPLLISTVLPLRLRKLVVHNIGCRPNHR